VLFDFATGGQELGLRVGFLLCIKLLVGRDTCPGGLRRGSYKSRFPTNQPTRVRVNYFCECVKEWGHTSVSLKTMMILPSLLSDLVVSFGVWRVVFSLS